VLWLTLNLKQSGQVFNSRSGCVDATQWNSTFLYFH
jgi:hypothetical protein